MKGTPNRITTAVKDMLLAALDEAGGVAYLREQAHANPSAFLACLRSVIPLQVKTELSGEVAVATRVVHEHRDA